MFPPQGVSSQSTPLDGPPPAPQAMGAGPMGQPTLASLSGQAPPMPADQMPPEVLTAIVSSAGKIAAMFDSYAQATPDMQVEWAGLKDHLQTVLAQLLAKGAGPTSPTATGSQWPGGGFDRGVAGAGTI